MVGLIGNEKDASPSPIPKNTENERSLSLSKILLLAFPKKSLAPWGTCAATLLIPCFAVFLHSIHIDTVGVRRTSVWQMHTCSGNERISCLTSICLLPWYTTHTVSANSTILLMSDTTLLLSSSFPLLFTVIVFVPLFPSCLAWYNWCEIAFLFLALSSARG